MTDRYPLRAAQTQRRARRASAEVALGDATAALERARHAAAQSEARLQAHRDAQPAGPAVPGPLRGVELARVAAFARRFETEQHALAAECASARSAVARLEAEAERARQGLASALADEQVIERDRAQHEAERRRETERRREHARQDERPTKP